MEDIEDFIEGPTSTVDDFQVDVIKGPRGNLSSRASLAASSAMVAESDPVEVYREVSQDLSDGRVDLMNQISAGLKTSQLQTVSNSFVEVMADPNLSVDEKGELADSYSRGMGVYYDSIRKVISREALVADSGNETIEAEGSRVSLLDTLDEIDEYTRFTQSLLNSENAKTNSTIVENVLNFAEVISPFVGTVQMANIVQEAKDDSTGAFLKTMALLGEGKMDLKETLSIMPHDQRMVAIQNIVEIINNHKSIVLTDDNDLARMDAISTFVEEGYYDDMDRIIDDAVSLLDMSLIGIPLAKLASSAKLASKARKAGKARDRSEYVEPIPMTQEEVDDIKRKMAGEQTTGQPQPSSVYRAIEDKNPDKSRKLLQAASEDETGEVAEAVFGTDRESALYTSSLPRMHSDNIDDIPGNLDEAIIEPDIIDPDLLDFSDRDGMIYFNDSEKRQARAAIQTDFQGATDITIRGSMSSFEETPSGMRINAVYGPEDGGWADGQAAVDYVKLALRRHGIDDPHITLLSRDRVGQYSPAGENDTGPFLVRVGYDYKFGPEAATVGAKVRYNFLDLIPGFKVPGKRGSSMQSFLVDFATMLDQRIAWAGIQKADRSFGIERAIVKNAEKFATGFAKLPGHEKDLISNFVKNANLGQVRFNRRTMRGLGISDDGIQSLFDWKHTWDQIYWLENADLRKTLSARGYGLYKDTSSGTELFGRELARNVAGKAEKYYDVTTGTVKTISDREISDLYRRGGSIVQLRSKFNVGNDVAEYVIAENTPGTSYVRALNSFDRPLNYREGYYQVHYNKPFFIVERVKDNKGKVLFDRAIGTAGSIEEAKVLTGRLKTSRGLPNDADDFFYRVDVKDASSEEDYFNVNMTHGRTAQKLRGQRLFDSNPSMLAGQDNILEPVESLNKSIRNISRRASMRDYLEATKARFMTQYADVLPKNEFGQVDWNNIQRDNISTAEPSKMKMAADARTTYDYITLLEVGRANAIDDGYKWMLDTMATFMAEKDMIDSGLEGFIRGLSEFRPTGFAKKSAFVPYLALNPQRQILVQSHQLTRLMAVNPLFITPGAGQVGKMYPQMTVLSFKRYGVPVPRPFLDAAGLTANEADEMWKQFEKSGLVAAVDANNLIRGDLKRLADITAWQKIKTGAGFPIQATRRVGFDAGENINITAAWLTYRDLAVKKFGNTLQDDVWDSIGADARNITYNMNFAGDMPYNENSLSPVTQFLQVPHKGVLQYFSRRLPTKAKVKMLAFDTVMWGIPSVTGIAVVQSLLDEAVGTKDEIQGSANEHVRHLIERGLESMLLNGFINSISEERSDIDFSSLAPTEIHAFTDTVSLFYSEGLGEMLAKTPSGQLYFGQNPRITNFFKVAMGYFELVDDYPDVESFSEVVEAFKHISSGYSNYFKAQYALEVRQKMSTASASVTDESVTRAEAIAQFFGFNTQDEVMRWALKKEQYENSQAIKDDLDMFMRDFSQMMAKTGLSQKEADFQMKLLQEFQRVYGNSPTARKYLAGKIRGMNSDETAMFMKRAFSQADMLDPEEYEKMINDIPNLDEGKKRILRQAGETLRGMR
jgi:hypothetical protein